MMFDGNIDKDSLIFDLIINMKYTIFMFTYYILYCNAEQDESEEDNWPEMVSSYLYGFDV
jgi:hypothetical protein